MGGCVDLRIMFSNMKIVHTFLYVNLMILLLSFAALFRLPHLYLGRRALLICF